MREFYLDGTSIVERRGQSYVPVAELLTNDDKLTVLLLNAPEAVEACRLMVAQFRGVTNWPSEGIREAVERARKVVDAVDG